MTVPVRGDLLSVVTPDERRLLIASAALRTWRRGDVLFREDDPGVTLHLVRKGHFAVRVSNAYGDVATLSVLGPGDSCGELALLHPDHRRTATVAALDSGETLALGRAGFEKIRTQQPGVDRLLIEMLATEVRRLSAQVMEVLFVPAETRVLRRLVAVAVQFGGGDVRAAVRVPLTQEELAALAGTTRPTANRALRAAVDGGVVRLRRGEVEVVDLARLRHLAGGTG